MIGSHNVLPCTEAEVFPKLPHEVYSLLPICPFTVLCCPRPHSSRPRARCGDGGSRPVPPPQHIDRYQPSEWPRIHLIN
ncbi:hypothetical protein BDV93DRAFT_519713 [Ceratobasidium sp. AG-I]|nr:hypothetical protein BDV93DRAFT_519713 [Ceratobasidium sp. AG-I]